MNWKANVKRWLDDTDLDEGLKQALENVTDEAELEDAFYTNLAFGTGGMRGLIGPGTNRMNRYTVRKAAEGLARFIAEQGEVAKSRGVVIAYDSRHYSPEFAMEAAKVIGHHGIQVYVFESLRTTPELSFAVRYLHAMSGIMITASHNPSAYNGFKVYGEDGGQFASEAANRLVGHVKAVTDELAIPVTDEAVLKEEGMLAIIGDRVDQAYLQHLETISIRRDVIERVADDFKIVYTPLHGTGNRPVREGLRQLGFKQVYVVKEQEQPDGDFPTVAYPNPEEPDAFQEAMAYGKRYDADLLLATDPDTDRVGAAVKNRQGAYQLLTGNQIGALLLHYLITEKEKQGALPKDATVLKTIVTSELGRDIAAAHGLETLDTLTGFKYISEKIKEFETTDEGSFLFGYEESYGYLIGDFVRDKDAVQACLLISEVAAYYKTKGKNLYAALMEIFAAYGYYQEGLESLTLEGKAGVEKIAAIIEDFRSQPPTEVAGKKVIIREDYHTRERVLVEEGTTETITLPTSNVLKYKLADASWFCIRPSGTEPKIKFYFGVKGESLEESKQKLAALTSDVMGRVGV